VITKQPAIASEEGNYDIRPNFRAPISVFEFKENKSNQDQLYYVNDSCTALYQIHSSIFTNNWMIVVLRDSNHPNFLKYQQ
jgi:hypothetical protein